MQVRVGRRWHGTAWHPVFVQLGYMFGCPCPPPTNAGHMLNTTMGVGAVALVRAVPMKETSSFYNIGYRTKKSTAFSTHGFYE